MNCSQVHRPTVILFWQKVPQVPFLHGFHLCDSRVGCLCPGKHRKSHRALSTVCQDLHAQSRALPYRPTQPQQSHRLAATLLHSLLSLFLSFTSHSTTSSSIGPQHCLSCSPLTKGDNQLALLLSSLQQHSNKLAPTLLSSAFRLPPPPAVLGILGQSGPVE